MPEWDYARQLSISELPVALTGRGDSVVIGTIGFDAVKRCLCGGRDEEAQPRRRPARRVEHHRHGATNGPKPADRKARRQWQ